MTTLYIAPGACSLGTQVVVRELQLPIDIVKVPLRQADSPIHRINPLGRVPALQLDNGTVITENTAILPYLADLKPEAGLIPAAGTVERALVQSWLGFGSAEIHAGAFRIVNRGGSWVSDEGAQQELKDFGKSQLRKSFMHVNNALQNNTWITGDNFTIADAYLGVFVRWLAKFGNEFDDLQQLRRFRDAYEARPSVIAALEFESAKG